MISRSKFELKALFIRTKFVLECLKISSRELNSFQADVSGGKKFRSVVFKKLSSIFTPC